MNQQQLNDEMVQGGTKRYHELVGSARDRDQESITPYGRRLISHYTEPISRGIAAWAKGMLKSAAGNRQPRVETVAILQTSGVSYQQMAFIGLTAIIDKLHRSPTFNSMIFDIGNRIQDEHRYNYLRKAAPPLYRKLKKQLDSHHTQIYRRQRETFILAMRRAEEKGDYEFKGATADYTSPPFQRWDTEDTMRLGGVVMASIAENTDLFQVHYLKRGKRKVKVISATPSTMKWIEGFNNWFSMTKPTWLPTVEKPLAWSNPFGGGYDGEQIAPLTLVKVRNTSYLRSLVGVEMPDVYEAINALQDTGWRINEPVLDVAKHIWNQGHGGEAGLPRRLDPVEEYLPPKPVDIDTNEEARIAWRREAAKIHTWYREEKGRNIQIANTLNLAQKYKGEKEFYFPYQLDFRGRTYTVPSFLSPQGNDLAKSLLSFSEGKPIDHKSAADWLAIAGANLYGIDKASYDERLAWTLAHKKEIEEVVRDPLSNEWWREADGGESAFCFLAWCYEWVGYLKQGYAYVCHYPVALDASNNGLQLLSLLCRDEVSGLATNCLPTESPEDIYSDVARLVMDKLVDIADPRNENEDEEKARFWLDYGVTRKTTKRPVMVFPYGGTKQSCIEYVKDWFQDKEKEQVRKALPTSGLSEPEQFTYALFLASQVWDALHELVNRPKHVMDWLQQVSYKFTEAKKPIKWQVPTGLYILQDYKNTRAVTVSLAIGGKQVRISGRKALQDYHRKRQKNGISPNFVHSLDAAVLHMCVAEAKKFDITQFSMIHDSYGVLPSDTDAMAAVIRRTFHRVFSEDLLAKAKREWEEELGEELPPLPEYGNMDISQILESEYLFS